VCRLAFEAVSTIYKAHTHARVLTNTNPIAINRLMFSEPSRLDFSGDSKQARKAVPLPQKKKKNRYVP